MKGHTLAGVLGCSILLAACADLHPENGQLRCAASPQRRCPRGYHCELPSETCWKDGASPTEDLGGGDLGEADLTPALEKGEACTAGGMPCATGHCVDGVCCDSPCTDSCKACNVEGSVGDCTRVSSGLPRGDRATCAGNGPCAGTCDGKLDGCSYPPAAVHCGADCSGTCDGAGACMGGGTGGCPDGLACEGASCRATCSAPEHCQPNFVCNAPACNRIPESDCLDGADNNGDGKKDCEDPSCAPLVECVPAVAAGNQIGLLVDAACAGDYGLTTVQHQGLNVPPCSACGCYVSTTCRHTLDFFSNGTCAGAPFGSAVSDAPDNTGVCVGAAAGQAAAVRFNAQTTVSSSCASSAPSTSTKTNPTWTTTKTFCGARTSATCPGTTICVRKPSAPLCVRIPATGAACPAGYNQNAPTAWNGAFVDDRACVCDQCMLGSSATCPPSRASAYLFYDSPSQCIANPGGGPNIGNAFLSAADGNGCVTNSSPGCTPGINCWASIGAVYVAPGSSATGGTCSRPGTAASGAATPTQGATICCQ